MSPIIVITSIIFIIGLLLIVGTTSIPFQFFKKVGINLVLGLFLLLTINYFGNKYGFNIPVNEFTTSRSFRYTRISCHKSTENVRIK